MGYGYVKPGTAAWFMNGVNGLIPPVTEYYFY